MYVNFKQFVFADLHSSVQGGRYCPENQQRL